MRLDVKPDATVDTRGTYCPMPIVLAKQAIEKMAVGEVLQVFSDDDGVLKDFPDWCARTGHEYLGTVEEDGEYRSLIRRRDG